MRLTHAPRFLLAAATLAIGSGCSADPNVPPPGVAGMYRATTFTLSPGGPAVNLLASGASLSITLYPNHTTTGRLVIPAALTGGDAVDENLGGTWQQSHDTVSFDGAADTFVRDVPFVVHGSSLTGEYTPPGGQLLVTLSKYSLD